MTSIAEPYLQIDSVGTELRLSKIGSRRRIRFGTYDVHIGGVWVNLSAGEPHISTGGPPIRALELYGFGPVAEQLLHLEARLRMSGGPLEMKDTVGDMFEVSFKEMKSSVFLSGTFFAEGDEEEFSYRIKLQDDVEVLGFALEVRWCGKRALFVDNISNDDVMLLLQAISTGSSVLADRMPWIA